MANFPGRNNMGMNSSVRLVANNATEASSSPPSAISHSEDMILAGSDYLPKTSMRSHLLTVQHS